MVEEGAIPRRPLVECCPLYSNYFAYSSGEKGSGIELYRIYRSPEIDAEGGRGEAGLVGQRDRHPYGAFALNQPYPTFADGRLANNTNAVDGYENPFVGVGQSAGSPTSSFFPRAGARIIGGSNGDDDMEGLLNTIPFSSGGVGISRGVSGDGGGGGGGKANEMFAENARTQSEWRRRASSARFDSEPECEYERESSRSTGFDSTSTRGKPRIWKHQLEGRSGSWQRLDEEQSQVTCTRWFPHGTSMGRDGMQASDICMLAVGYSSGKVGLTRFADDGGNGESVCVVAAASANRACNAVAWDPARPARLAAGWAKSRYDNCIRVYDINYVEQWHSGIGAASAEAAAKAAEAAVAEAEAAAAAAMHSTSTAAAAAEVTAAEAAGEVLGMGMGIGMGMGVNMGMGMGVNMGMGMGLGLGGNSSGVTGDDYGSITAEGWAKERGVFPDTRGTVSGVLPGPRSDVDVVGDMAAPGYPPLGSRDGDATAAAAAAKRAAAAAAIAAATAAAKAAASERRLVFGVEGGTGAGMLPRRGSLREGGGRLDFGGGSSSSVWPIAPITTAGAGWNSLNMAATSMWDYKQQFNEGCASLSWIPGHDSLLAAGMLARYLRILDIRSKNCVVKSVEAHRGAVTGVSVRGTDSRVLATWSDTPGEPVKIWDVRKLQDTGAPTTLGLTTPHTVATLRPRSASSVIDVAWSPNRLDMIATVHTDNPRRLWLWRLRRHSPRQNPWTWSGYRYTSDPISSISWQPRRLRPRPLSIPSADAPVPAAAAVAASASGESLACKHAMKRGKGLEDDIKRRNAAAVEDEEVTLKFPHRLLTVSAERRFVENIGPMEMCALAVSCHGDAWRGQGFCSFEGSAERSGFCTRVDKDATFSGDGLAEDSPVSNARRNIARSRKLPDIAEVMKWRAQAGYRTDPVHNSNEIFASEFAYKMETPTRKRSSSSADVGAMIATADIVSGCRLWSWVDRIERLCEEKRRQEEAFALGGGIELTGLGMTGNQGLPFIPRPQSVRGLEASGAKTKGWDRVGLLDAGIMDILAEEFEACRPSGDSGHNVLGSEGVSSALPAHCRHPTLGCKVFSSPARDLAIRACGWGVPADFATRDTGMGLGGRMDLASGDKRLKECPGVPEGLGDLMLECERLHQYERSAALAVFHGDLRAAVKAFSRARGAVKQRHLENRQSANAAAATAAAAAAAVAAAATAAAAAMGQGTSTVESSYEQPVLSLNGSQGEKVMPALWTDAVNYDQLLFTMSMCIASFRPPSHSGQGQGQRHHDECHHDEAGQDWEEMVQDLLNRKELRKKDAAAAQFRACCLFLKSIQEICCSNQEASRVSHNASVENPQLACFFEGILKDPLLWLEDRVALACMFLPPTQLKAFLTAEAERCMSRGVLDGALLFGMGPAGVQLLQAYVDRTSDIQTAALVGSRAAIAFPGSWKAERMQVAEWVETYRDLLHKWQFWFNKTKLVKWTRKAKAAFEDHHPLSPEAAERLETIKMRHAQSLFLSSSSSSPVDTPPTRTPANASVPSNSTSGAPASATELMSTERRSERNGGAGVSRPGMGAIIPDRGATGANASSSKGDGLSGNGNPGSVDREGVGRGMEASGVREPWPDNGGVRGGLTDRGKSYDGFGGGVPPSRHLRLRCNFCGNPVGIGDALGSGDHAGAAGGGDHSQRPSRSHSGANRTRAKPFIGYCHSCRKPLPRCYVCLQHIDAINPDMETRRQLQTSLGKGVGAYRGAPAATSCAAGAGSSGVSSGRMLGVRIGGGEDGSKQGSRAPGISRDKWIARCNTCWHVGHAHHLSYWFATHDTCGVNGCGCKCMSLDSPVV